MDPFVELCLPIKKSLVKPKKPMDDLINDPLVDPAPLDVVVVGNVGIDTNIYLNDDYVDLTVETHFTQNLDYVGQAGGFSSRGFAQLGKKTAFIGHVGADYHGRFIRETLASDGINLSGLFLDPAGTARSVNLVYPDGRRKSFYDGRGHMDFMPDAEICQNILSRARFAHFSIPNWARYLLPIAQELDLTISCDIQDVIAADDPYRQEFVDSTNILFFSAANQADPRILIESFLENRPELVIIAGMGAEGCALGTQQGIRYFEAVPLARPVVDTNGAGDSLAVGFLSSYILDGYTIEESILRGQIAARFACSIKATSSDLITADQLEQRYQASR